MPPQPTAAGERQRRDQALRGHAGQMADAVANFPIELHDRFAVAILRPLAATCIEST
jgi:hypothetical protein